MQVNKWQALSLGINVRFTERKWLEGVNIVQWMFLLFFTAAQTVNKSMHVHVSDLLRTPKRQFVDRQLNLAP